MATRKFGTWPLQSCVWAAQYWRRYAAQLALLSTSLCLSCTEPIQPGPTARGETVVSANYGGGPHDLGAVSPDEASPRGPLSFAVSRDERQVFVLDQENNRIQVFEGDDVVQAIPLPSPTVVDLGVLDSGNLVLLDPNGQHSLLVIDRQGRLVSQTPMAGVGVPEPELAASIRVRSDGVWVGYRGRSTRVLDVHGAADAARPTLFGELTRDERFLISLSAAGTTLGVLKRERTGLPKNRKVTLSFDQPVIHVLMSDSDSEGNLYLVTLHIWGTGDAQQAKTLLTVLSPELREIKHLTLPTQDTAYEVFRYGEVGASGVVYYLDVARSEARVQRFL